MYCYLLFNRNWSETRQEIQASLYWGPCCSREKLTQVTGSLAHTQSWAGSFHGMKVGVGLWSSQRRGLGILPTTLVVLYAGGKHSTLLLLPTLQKWHLGFWSFCILFIICPNCICTPEKAMAPHSRTVAWQISWMEKPGGLQSLGSLKVRHDWTTSLSLFTFMHWRGKWQPTPVFLPGESQGQGSLVGCRLWGRSKLNITEVI